MSGRTQAVRATAQRRQRRERRGFVPLRAWVAAIVATVAATSKPAIGWHGQRLALAISLVVFVVEMLFWPLTHRRALIVRVAELMVFGASAVALAALQPGGLSALPASAVVFTAGFALAPPLAGVVGAAVTVGVGVALSRAGSVGGIGGVDGVSAAVLLCAVLGVTGGLLRQYRLSQERTELLLAELEDARDDQARAAAAEERAAIARELHDVLAHSLSGLSIQLEVARRIATTTAAPADLAAAISDAAGLAKQGVAGARDAVAALRRSDELGLEQLPDLVGQFRRDLHLDVAYDVIGSPRPVPGEIGLAVYRATGEALTNIARHAAGAVTRVSVTFTTTTVQLNVTNTGGHPSELAAHGSGWGLAGMRERVKRLGGELNAGPYGTGWTVALAVPTASGLDDAEAARS